MTSEGKRLVLRRSALRAMGDDGLPCGCLHCVRNGGRRPERCLRPSLSRDVLVLAAPYLDVMALARFELWLAILASAARAWNTGAGAATPFALADAATGERLDVGALVEHLAERKRLLFPDDDRVVERVELAETGAFWCKPLGRGDRVEEPRGRYVLGFPARSRAA